VLRDGVAALFQHFHDAVAPDQVERADHDEIVVALVEQVSKLPGLGHIPIIGELFKNSAFDSTKRELVIFVTPRIVNPDSDKIRTIIEDVKSRYKQARGEVNFGIFD